MTSGILVGVLLCAAGGLPTHGAEPDGAEKKKKDVPVYTDDDLRRVSPLRDQTGGGMQPAASPPATASAADGSPGRGDEAYWRREAERLRARLEAWRERAVVLRAEIDERHRSAGLRGHTDPRIESLQRRLAALEERIKEAEDHFQERARRAGARPGWLR